MKNIGKLICLFIFAFVIWTTAFADAVKQPGNGIVGTWKLVSYARINEDGSRTNVLGPLTPEGVITYTPDGKMFFMLTCADRAKPATDMPNDKEAATLYKSIFAYAGTYKITGQNTLEHHVDLSWNPSWKGVHQRQFKVDGDALTITSTQDPWNTSKGDRVFVFKKVK